MYRYLFRREIVPDLSDLVDAMDQVAGGPSHGNRMVVAAYEKGPLFVQRCFNFDLFTSKLLGVLARVRIEHVEEGTL